jgi:integrase
MTTALEAAGAEPTAAAIEAAAQLRWGTVAPATWNRHAATIRSFLGYAARHGLLGELRVALDRRREPADRTCALPKAALERLWSRRDVALRDKTLGRLLYETAARASEALSLNVEDLDLPARRAFSVARTASPTAGAGSNPARPDDRENTPSPRAARSARGLCRPGRAAPDPARREGVVLDTAAAVAL